MAGMGSEADKSTAPRLHPTASTGVFCNPDVCLSVHVENTATHGDTHCQVKHGVHGERCMAREEGLSV